MAIVDRSANLPPSARQPMSRTTMNSKLANLEDAVDSNCKHMGSEIEKIHDVNARTEEKLTSLANRLDQAEVGLPSFYPYPCTA